MSVHRCPCMTLRTSRGNNLHWNAWFRERERFNSLVWNLFRTSNSQDLNFRFLISVISSKYNRHENKYSLKGRTHIMRVHCTENKSLKATLVNYKILHRLNWIVQLSSDLKARKMSKYAPLRTGLFCLLRKNLNNRKLALFLRVILRATYPAKWKYTRYCLDLCSQTLSARRETSL